MNKFKIFLLAILCGFTLFSCKPSADKAKPKKAKTSKVVKKKKAKSTFLDTAEKNLKLSKSQVSSLKAINTKFAKQTEAYKKAKKWDGKTGAPNRKRVETARAAEQKKVLGSKYNAFVALRKKHNQPAKKTPKKKKPSKKKK